MPTVVDVHAHAIVPAALAEMTVAHPGHAPTLVETGQGPFLDYPGRGTLGPLPNAIFAPDLRRAAMHDRGVDRQIIAVPPPHYHYHVPVAVGRDFARIQNDALRELSGQRPRELHVFATLPLQDIPAALRELERVATDDRVRGVQMGTNIEGTDLDDPSLTPLWEALESLDMPVWLHPDQRAIAGADRLGDFYLQNLVGLPMESTIAAARLVFGGVLERFPTLRFGLVHGGGFSPYQVGRWDHGWEVRREPRERIEAKPPSHYYGSLFFDSLTHDALSLEMLGRRIGWDHVLLGSDYPFDMASPDPVGTVESIGLDREDVVGVLGGNAARFLRPVA